LLNEIAKEQQSLLDYISKDFEISRGNPLPLGAALKRGGINLAVFSRNADSVSLVLFKQSNPKQIAEFPLDPRYHRTGDIWHILIKGLDANIEYGYRMDKHPNNEKQIHRFDPSCVLIDPYAKAISGGEVWGKISNENIDPIYYRHQRSLVINDDFDWGFDQPLKIPTSDTIIYELHVRGFTRHKSSNIKYPGTYAGLIEKIPYLKELGITAVELLPINEFSEIDTNRVNPRTGERLLNYWGYHSLGFFAPKASYASCPENGNQVREFKTMVKAFHENGIEVILDMVFNHTAEGDHNGPTLSFRGLDNSIYYLIDPHSGEYYNYSGCGNTLNCNHPVVRDLILECLRYWVMEMHVDGFRFDLASILGRGRDGSVLANPPLLERIAADPILSSAKLIAEAWDAAGLYQVGSFPSWGRWAEWNAKFRDHVRKFIKGDPGVVSELADCIMGSSNLYAHSGRTSYHSINFVTCHDGFTLADIVSYNEKHNEENGEDNRDGANDNNSWNCGVEGPAGDNPDADKINKLRQRQIRNFAALLLLSRGVPMILAGDESGRTQRGNNNAYCQDNEISWMDWDLAKKNKDLFRFFKLLIEFRKNHPALRFESLTTPEEILEYGVKWHGIMPDKPDWSYESRSFALQITENAASNPSESTEIYIAANAYWKPLIYFLPKLPKGKKWFRVVDTMRFSPYEICENNTESILKKQNRYKIGSRSVVVLIGK